LEEKETKVSQLLAETPRTELKAKVEKLEAELANLRTRAEGGAKLADERKAEMDSLRKEIDWSRGKIKGLDEQLQATRKDADEKMQVLDQLRQERDKLLRESHQSQDQAAQAFTQQRNALNERIHTLE